MIKYFKSQGFAVIDAVDHGHYLIMVPYKAHTKVNNYLKKKEITYKIRFDHSYDTAIYYI